MTGNVFVESIVVDFRQGIPGPVYAPLNIASETGEKGI